MKEMNEETEQLELDFKDYFSRFVGHRQGPYAIQSSEGGRGWITRYEKISDRLIQEGHLKGKYWVAIRSPWYPDFAYVDVDHPAEGRIDHILGGLGLRKGAYLICTSPRYWEQGNVHILFRPRYRSEPMTIRLLRDSVGKVVEEDLQAELYPHPTRVGRLPFGKDQFLIDEELGMPLPYSWREALPWAEKLDEYEIPPKKPQPKEKKPSMRAHVETEAIYRQTHGGKFRPKHIPTLSEGSSLFRSGLMEKGTRHDATFCLAMYFYRLNIPPVEAQDRIEQWIRAKHHDKSGEIVKGNWRRVDGEIARQIEWTYRKLPLYNVWPDNTNNIEGFITQPDLRLIGETFAGDLVNQRRMFKLLLYYRPRGHWDWVFISGQRWQRIVGIKYPEFQRLLQSRGIMEADRRYQVGKFSRKYKLDIPYINRNKALKEDGRTIHDFADASIKAFGSQRNVIEALRLKEGSRWGFFNEPKEPEILSI